MTTKPFIFAALTIFSSAAALAEDFADQPKQLGPSTVTRAEVRQAAIQARAAGRITEGEIARSVDTTGTTLTRAQVHAETLEALRIGAVSRHNHDSFATPAQLDQIHMAGLRAVAMTVAAR